MKLMVIIMRLVSIFGTHTPPCIPLRNQMVQALRYMKACKNFTSDDSSPHFGAAVACLYY